MLEIDQACASAGVLLGEESFQRNVVEIRISDVGLTIGRGQQQRLRDYVNRLRVVPPGVDRQIEVVEDV